MDIDNSLVYLLAAALVTGFSKFSVGGMGLLILPILMTVYSGPEALGIILPMYVLTDIMVIGSYRQSVSWLVIARLMPLIVMGVGLGGWFLSSIDADQFRYILVVIILVMLLFSCYLDYRDASFMRHRLVANIVGGISGFISLTANSAGPLVSLYLMEQRLSKTAYMSTRAWLFLLTNLAKIPLLVSIGFINTHSLSISLQGIPGLILGAFVGYFLVARLKLSQFKWLIRAMAVIAAAKLMLS